MAVRRKRTKRPRGKGKKLPNWGLLALGLAIGVIFTILIQIFVDRVATPGSGLGTLVSRMDKPEQTSAQKRSSSQIKNELPKPKFDFYTILPAVETVLPQAQSTKEKQDAKPPVPEKTPLSGMTLIAVTILIIMAKGLDDSAAIIAAVMVGAAACVAMSQATDLMLDLKTGYLVGATPRMQQMGQFFGAWLGPIVIIILIFVLHEAHGLGSTKLPAPQGQALASMITGILGGDVPTEKYLAGAGMGALLSAASGGLGITVGLGFYLPFNIVLTYSIGTVLRLLSDRYAGVPFSEEKGIPIAAGFIVGEALVGVGFAIRMVLAGSAGQGG